MNSQEGSRNTTPKVPTAIATLCSQSLSPCHFTEDDDDDMKGGDAYTSVYVPSVNSSDSHRHGSPQIHIRLYRHFPEGNSPDSSEVNTTDFFVQPGDTCSDDNSQKPAHFHTDLDDPETHTDHLSCVSEEDSLSESKDDCESPAREGKESPINTVENSTSIFRENIAMISQDRSIHRSVLDSISVREDGYLSIFKQTLDKMNRDRYSVPRLRSTLVTRERAKIFPSNGGIFIDLNHPDHLHIFKQAHARCLKEFRAQSQRETNGQFPRENLQQIARESHAYVRVNHVRGGHHIRETFSLDRLMHQIDSCESPRIRPLAYTFKYYDRWARAPREVDPQKKRGPILRPIQSAPKLAGTAQTTEDDRASSQPLLPSSAPLVLSRQSYKSTDMKVDYNSLEGIIAHYNRLFPI